MGQVIILGSASAIPTREQENTHILIQSGERLILVDSPGTPIVRLQEAEANLDNLTDVILTHFHPDHVSGFAPLLMGLWLLGRTKPLKVYGLRPTVERAQKMMELYGWESWPRFYPVEFISIPNQEKSVIIEGSDLRVLASPVDHMIPTIGLRIETTGTHATALAYSCDTEPSAVVVRLAQGAQVLIHEATGEGIGHTSPRQAGEIAAQAGVESLYLIHYPPQSVDGNHWIAEAGLAFSGPVYLAKDFQKIQFN